MDVMEAISKRRARRALDADKKIPDDIILNLIDAMRLSASCFNNQPWRAIFITGEHVLEEVQAALPRGNQWATRAPLIIAIAAKKEDDCVMPDGRDYYLFDCGLAVGQMVLAATDMGIIAHPIAGYSPEAVRTALGIPEDYMIIALIICGYPGDDMSLLSEKQKRDEVERPERKPVWENFFRDRWGKPVGWYQIGRSFLIVP